MKIGTLLHLERFDLMKKEIIKYHCKVIEKNEQHLLIDYPINQQTKRNSILLKGENFSVIYAGSDQNIYYFQSEVVAKVNLTVPALAIKLPDKSDIKRIQRREFVRIETAVDVSLHSVNQRFSPFVTVTSDMSGGGISIVLPEKHTLGVGNIADIWMPLQFFSGEYKYIHAKAEVVFLKLINHKLPNASLKFTEIPKHSQQDIIRYCFEKQREARKKELTP